MGGRRNKVVEGVEFTGRVICRKVRHESREDADALKPALYRKNRRAKRGRRPIVSYFCIHCRGWHLGRDWGTGGKRR